MPKRRIIIQTTLLPAVTRRLSLELTYIRQYLFILLSLLLPLNMIIGRLSLLDATQNLLIFLHDALKFALSTFFAQGV